MKYLLFVYILLSACIASSQIVVIPDSVFKIALLEHDPVIDINEDGEIQFSEAEAVTLLQLNHKDIVDLTGIEAFLYVTDLNVNGNLLTSVNLSQNTMLLQLNLSQNLLTELSVSQNVLLEELEIQFNELNAIDISEAINLKQLHASQNFLTSIDLSNNLELERLVLNDNSLTQLDLSNQSNLKLLELVANSITALDLTQSTPLKVLDLSNNNLSSIDLSNNTDLRAFRMMANPLISEVDLSNNHNLCQVWLSHNDALAYINLQNGNNLALDATTPCSTTVGTTTSGASLIENPALEIVCVDNILFAEEHFDTSYPVDYIEDCQLGLNNYSLATVVLYPNPVASELNVTATGIIEEISVYNMLSQKLLSQNVSASEETIDLSQLSSGNYLVNVQTSRGTAVFRIIKK
ncbi:T9SS type A sorting domain-containing protein [Ulvibacter antarcticus]|uniref:Putative secreted protein (Por secretion system target) n=1 Tax=Ulvibacter antarcticus TaxID=442714 RepID=A0A3L9ZHV3_9FLAO|nr:T9SS type A sorting domain-containing protein [Ulvibacter antarcticus]RMA66292.1 putative secreted protein (Por secretion system target) [Ulvibacter antarcticus]